MFNSFDMMLWTWLMGQFLINIHYQALLRNAAPRKGHKSVFKNQLELVVACALITKAETTGYQFPSSAVQRSKSHSKSYKLDEESERTNDKFLIDLICEKLQVNIFVIGDLASTIEQQLKNQGLDSVPAGWTMANLCPDASERTF